MTKTYIIAEAGVNHNGNIDLGYKLIDAAKKSGADAVKFQTFKTNKLITNRAKKPDYQISSYDDSIQSSYQLLKSLELKFSDFSKLKLYAKKQNIEFLSTPDDEDSLNFLADKLKILKIKIGSGEVTNLPFIKKIALKNKPIIISSGMANMSEIGEAIKTIRKYNKKKLTVLHCTTNYPCPFEDVNLNAMNKIKTKFNVDIGYSDHTIGSEVPISAVALGAKVIEKHLTLNTKFKGPDHKASMNPLQFKKMVQQIRNIELAMGNGIKKSTKNENHLKSMIIKRLIAVKNLKKNTKINLNHLVFKRSDQGIFVNEISKIIGKKLLCDIKKNQALEWSFFKK
tara:strand:- start:962 stop:1981 length:1020 start_codon:yes stop_codon:yes gene_type:complete